MDKQQRSKEASALKELRKLLAKDKLRIPTNIHRCHGVSNELFPYYSPEDIIHPTRDKDRWNEEVCDNFRYDLKSFKHIVLHDVARISDMDSSGRAWAYSPDYEEAGRMTRTIIVGVPSALLFRLTEWDN